MKYNERRKKPAKKKSEAEIIVKLDKKVNNTNDVEYKFRSGIETFVHIPKRVLNKYPQRKPLKPDYYPKVSAISSRSRNWDRYAPCSECASVVLLIILCEKGLTIMFVFIFDFYDLYLLVTYWLLISFKTGIILMWPKLVFSEAITTTTTTTTTILKSNFIDFIS